jgi:hypothetical protein
VLELAAIASWFVIVITGKQPKGLQDVIGLGVSYISRANALFLLVTETYPPFNDDQSRQIGEPAPATPLPQQPAPVGAPEVPAGFEPPVAPEPPAAEDDPPPGPFGPSSTA